MVPMGCQVKRGTAVVAYLHPGELAACFVNSLIDLLFYDAANGQRVVSHAFGHMGKEAGAGHLASARNKVTEAFMARSEAEWLWWVDSDMGFGPDTIDRLVASADPSTRPVVGALCFAQKSDGEGPFYARRYRACPTIYRMYENDTEVGYVPQFDYPRDQLVETDATGAACLLVHRSAVEKVHAEHGPRWFSQIELPTKAGDGVTSFGEDMSFSLRLVHAGVPLFVDTSVKTTHDKGGVFFDEDTYDLQQSFRVHAGA